MSPACPRWAQRPPIFRPGTPSCALCADLDRTVSTRVGGEQVRFKAGYEVHQRRIGLDHRLNRL
ncbi:hypothetical protein M446_6463 [Methylobacterium sp. 4-46]|uniref:hypothetical protein n=1 Tax=unclassified Methylobacterium TaxID=2615210 RepID=UPI000165CD75|nr:MULTISPECIES: hypothetical protein [Methylobacterium]ACA20722.1 hypothetical protein M446_6463 [Methylobacterium sp. 4-46]WFT79877.1 hypothetical protein QA634_32620 [Methylobacterium nodulans]